MARYTHVGLLSLLVGSALAAPAPQSFTRGSGNGDDGSWSPGNWKHHTVGTPISRPAPSTSSSSSTPYTTSSTTTTGTSATSSSITPASTTTVLTSSLLPTFTTSPSTSTSDTPTTSTTSTSTSHPTSTSAAYTSSSAAYTSSSASATATAGSGKRGMAYNDASYASLFDSAEEVTWGYDWWSNSNGLSSSYNFVPLLWGSTSDFTDAWAANIAGSLAAGSTHLLSFNEPDLSSQSDMTPAAAAEAYLLYMQPYAGHAKLGSPAVTNGDSSTMGLDWLSSFMDSCTECTIDYIPLHWYNDPGTADDFMNHITSAFEMFGKPIWITEFGLNDPTDAEVITFLEQVLPWLDEQDFVERYAYFMVAEGYLLNSAGTALSDYGSTFATYTG